MHGKIMEFKNKDIFMEKINIKKMQNFILCHLCFFFSLLFAWDTTAWLHVPKCFDLLT